ncbi:hypothetical protein MLD38_014777 [Melastoma candidum]|uniref:Uncharacterized protein n=1 Tax=Melastoma candidum TaxID=119954 RepID=A0ACB9RH02_9MYRT|nr:hypothetical protein MLD38_014777 [Melastoma candidum]
MDFISGFPKVDGLSSIMVVVDRFSKYGVFVAAPHACTAEVAAELFHKNVVKHFGLPTDIVSDRDAFTGRFWTQLFSFLGSELKFSMANHPQTDGQTERANAVLEEYFRHYSPLKGRVLKTCPHSTPSSPPVIPILGRIFSKCLRGGLA